MMKPEEAIELLKEGRERRIACLYIGYKDVALEALEKQVAKKSVRVVMGANGSTTDGCPVCGKEFFEMVNYCPSCGQKVDWSKTE